eukprot:Rhum_TRINITY_DN12381_c0_g2::Rhum_TRINITY_DN12381_c0_g2_i1::g.51494::m.51494
MSSLDAAVRYDDEIGELLDDIESKVAQIGGANREALVLSAKENVKDCKKKLHSLKVEIRGLEQIEDKRHYEKKVSDKQSRLLQLQKQLKEKEDEGTNAVFGAGAGEEEDGRKEVRDVFTKIDKHQDASKAAVDRMIGKMADTEATGHQAAAALANQGEMLKDIDDDLDKLGDDIQRAKKELHAFARRMATDKLILCCLFLLVLGVVVAIILKFVLPSDDKNNDVPGTPAPAP